MGVTTPLSGGSLLKTMSCSMRSIVTSCQRAGPKDCAAPACCAVSACSGVSGAVVSAVVVSLDAGGSSAAGLAGVVAGAAGAEAGADVVDGGALVVVTDVSGGATGDGCPDGVPATADGADDGGVAGADVVSDVDGADAGVDARGTSVLATVPRVAARGAMRSDVSAAIPTTTQAASATASQPLPPLVRKRWPQSQRNMRAPARQPASPISVSAKRLNPVVDRPSPLTVAWMASTA